MVREPVGRGARDVARVVGISVVVPADDGAGLLLARAGELDVLPAVGRVVARVEPGVGTSGVTRAAGRPSELVPPDVTPPAVEAIGRGVVGAAVGELVQAASSAADSIAAHAVVIRRCGGWIRPTAGPPSG